MKPLTSAELLAAPPLREFMLLVGKDGVGKSSALISLAMFVQMILNPEATFYVIDTENKFRAALHSFKEKPSNLMLYKCEDMNQVTSAWDQIHHAHKPGDWLAVESMSRIWERAQDLGYQAITGTMKAEYMEKRRAAKKGGTNIPVTPQPADLWNIVKGAHDGAFLDELSQSETLNVVLSSTIAKPPKPDSFMKENADRAAVRKELGIDMGIDGAPRLPYYIQTLALLDLNKGAVSCRILRDNLSQLETPRVEFPVENKGAWAFSFWGACR